MIYFVRHGQTSMNKAKVFQGRCDLPLDETGVAQAQGLHERVVAADLHFGKVYSSPLSRAQQTAHIVAPEASVQVDERLIEIDFGVYEGRDYSDPSFGLHDFFAYVARGSAPEGMESFESMVARMRSFLDDIHDEALDTDILICTHGMAMKGGLVSIDPDAAKSYWPRRIGNCAVYAVEALPDGGWSIPQEW